VKDGQVGRVNQFGNFWAFTPGMEIIFDGKIFMPPFNTEQRRVPDALGPYKLDMGDGYLIHGTNPFNEDTIGGAVSHGCVRLANDDVDRLYHMVDTGVAVFIY
jgi:lipoprotein-anchoring transpeptidase ErfK/SrfK